MNLLKAATMPISFYISFALVGGARSMIACTVFVFASISLLFTMNPKNFLDATPNTHLQRFSFILYCLNFLNIFFQILDVGVFPQAFHQHVVYVYFHGLSNHVSEHFVYDSLRNSSCILEPERRHPTIVQSLVLGEGGLFLILRYILI